MKLSNTLTALALTAALLVAGVAAVGAFWQTGGQPFPFTTLHGATVEIYGQGLYRYDMSVIAVGYRIGDAYALFGGVPCLLGALWLSRRRSLRGGLLLVGLLAYLLYQYGSSALGAAYNRLFLGYILITSLTLLGVFAAVRAVDVAALPQRYAVNAPRRGTAIFLMATGGLLFLIWFLLSLLPALLTGTPPAELGSYTTITTFVVDMGLVAPTLVAGGLLLWRRDPLGYLLAPILLVFMDVLGVGLIVMGGGQMLLGLMSVGQFFGFVVSFAILTVVSLGFTVALFRRLS